MQQKTVLEIDFIICPRDLFVTSISLSLNTIEALNHAAKSLGEMSDGRYQLILTRGYIYWGRWRRFRSSLAKIIFCILYWSDKASVESLFGHNGHNDGFSVDVMLYDAALKKKIRWLSWRNIFISRTAAQKILDTNKSQINLLDDAMKSANFISHADPREKLQAHYRLNEPIENTGLVTLEKN